MKRLLLLCACAWPTLAWAHGGLPVSEAVVRQAGGDTMYIPVAFWGLWIGDGVAPWRWICEEEINLNRARKYTLSTDGTFYTNDTRGVTVSNDHGCTWVAATGELSTLRTTDVLAHPTDGATAWVTTDDVIDDADGGQIVNNALFVTHDHGTTFTRVPGLDGNGRRFQSVKASSDGNTVYVTSAGPMTPFDVTVHRSDDGGNTFTATPLPFTLDGASPYALEAFLVDPRDPNGLYLRAFVTVPDPDAGDLPLHVLLRSSDGGKTVTEILHTVGSTTPAGSTQGINGGAIDVANNKLYVATVTGLLVGDDPGGDVSVNLQPVSKLTQAQCVDVHSGALYVCSSNYAPDFAAIGKSVDNAMTFTQALSYQLTEGPVDCPASTPVGAMCPYYWLTYSAQLGINMGIDGGAGDGGGGGKSGGCSCEVGGTSSLSLVAFALVALVVVWRRRRA